MGFKAVLFDLDGTLLDTLEDVADATNLALAELGFPTQPVEAFKYLIGDGVENLVRRVVPPPCADAATLARCAERLRKEYAARWAVKSRPYEGVPEMLDALAARGVPMAVFSNKPHEFAKLCVARLLPDWSFAVVLGESDRFPRKPDPAGALAIAAQLKLAPAEFVYLGDTNTDMRTAVAAGMYPVGALWGFRTAEELTAHGAKVLLEKPQELLDVVFDGPS